MRLSIYDEAPTELEMLDASQVGALIDGPSLIHLEGAAAPPLVVSVLLHGNETTSWTVARELISRARNRELDRSILLFVGNVRAAAAKKRYLPDQIDYNRIWSGGERPEHALATETLNVIRSAQPFAVIDIHNNTGRNPLYSCVSRLEPAHLHLASVFSDIAVYYTNPPSALSIACAAFAPSIAIECGKPGDASGLEAALTLIDNVMALAAFRSDFEPGRGLELYHTLGRIFLKEGASFSFDGAPAEVEISPEIENWNFTTVGVETVWARSNSEAFPLIVVDELGADLTARFFQHAGGETRLIGPSTPAMLSTDRDNVRLDCLGYLMEKVAIGGNH